jgi:hypothetical protein
VALKVVPREGKAGLRAEREMQVAVRLRHPRCLRALGIERDDRHVYVTYEYIPGKTLRQTLREGALDDAGAVEAAAQMLDGLAHAHAKGIVHRDVKPANVMLENGEELSVRILDFGLAQLEEAETLTAAGDVPGTLGYIAPERLAGRDASGAADVWSVGVLLWEALAGRHPFWAVSPLETARRVGAGAPPLAAVRPDLPRELSAAVDRMLRVDPTRRPGPKQMAIQLRAAWAGRLERTRAVTSRTTLSERAVHAGLCALFAGGTSFLLPFFPTAWPILLTALAGAAALARPQAGLAAALAVPLLPLGNVALGLAIAYAALALGWFLLFARDARSGLLFAVGPLLAPLGLLPLAVVVAVRARGAARRTAGAVLAVLASLAVPELGGQASPAIAGQEDPRAVLDVAVSFLAAHPGQALEALVFAAAAAAAPIAVARGLVGAGLWGAAFLAGTLAIRGAADPVPLVLGISAATALLAVPLLRQLVRSCNDARPANVLQRKT